MTGLARAALPALALTGLLLTAAACGSGPHGRRAAAGGRLVDDVVAPGSTSPVRSRCSPPPR